MRISPIQRGVAWCLVMAGLTAGAGCVQQESGRNAKEPKAVTVEDPAAEKAKMAFVQRHRGDCEHVSDDGLDPTFEGGSRLRAWALLCTAWAGEPKRAMDAAQAWAASAPADPWAGFAVASLLSLEPEEISEAVAAVGELPGGIDPADELWLRTRVALNSGAYQRAVRGLDEAGDLVDARAELSALRAASAFRVASRVQDPVARSKLQREALAQARRVQERWPELVEAYTHPLEAMLLADPELLPVEMAEQLVRIAPDYPRARLLLWHLRLKSESEPFPKRRAAILADVDRAAVEHADDPAWLFHIASAYEFLRAGDALRATQEKILSRHPDSAEAEVIQYSRLLASHNEIGRMPPGKERKQRRVQWLERATAFLEREHPTARKLDGHVLSWLFDYYAEQPTCDDSSCRQQLLSLADRLAEHWRATPAFVYFHVPRVLAEKAGALDEALVLARRGAGAMEAYELTMQIPLGPIELSSWRATVQSKSHETVGWVLARRGAVDEAIVEFNSAVALDPENVDARIELGRVYVKQGRPKVAETEFLEAYARGNPDQRAQAEAELQGLFRRLRVDGDFHEVLRARLTASRARQKERVLASRIEGPSLGDLRDLRPIASKIERSALDGKVVVVEVWATWCGPCVRSLRHFDRAWREDYRADAAVEFLTLSTDDDPSLPRGFLEAEQHTVPACQDHGFARRMGVSTYPTTLFFDRNGQLRFVKEGNAGVPAEELAWRIDALR